MLTDYFHKKYYSDLPIEVVDAAINKDENTYNKAVEFIHKNHYSDIDPIVFKEKLTTSLQSNSSENSDNPFSVKREYKEKPKDQWSFKDFKEYKFDMDNGFTDNSSYSKYAEKLNANPFDKLKNSDSIRYRRNIENAYLNQTIEGIDKIDKSNPFYDKKPSYDKLTPEKIVELKKYIDDNSLRYNEDEEWGKLGTTKNEAISSAMLTRPKLDYLEYLDSPQYAEIAKKTFGNNYENAINAQKERAKNVNIQFGDEKELGTAFGEYKDMNIDVRKPNAYPQGPLKYTTSHEISHATDDGLKDYTFGVDLTKTDSKTPNDIKKLGDIWSKFVDEKSISKSTTNGDLIYLNNPTEVRARVNSIRQHLLKNKIDLNLDDQNLDEFINKVWVEINNISNYKKCLKKKIFSRQ
jgi:hypothetical protein